MLRSSWALNTLDVREAVTSICGTKAGGDMNRETVTVNGVRNGRQYQTEYNMKAGGVAFYEGSGGAKPEDREARLFYNAILHGTKPSVDPEEAYCVTKILEGIYTSAKTGKMFVF